MTMQHGDIDSKDDDNDKTIGDTSEKANVGHVTTTTTTSMATGERNNKTMTEENGKW